MAGFAVRVKWTKSASEFQHPSKEQLIVSVRSTLDSGGIFTMRSILASPSAIPQSAIRGGLRESEITHTAFRTASTRVMNRASLPRCFHRSNGVRPSQAVWCFSKSGDRRVIMKGDAERRRPFRVPWRVLAKTCEKGLYGVISFGHSRTHTHAVTSGHSTRFSAQTLARLAVSRGLGYRGVASACMTDSVPDWLQSWQTGQLWKS